MRASDILNQIQKGWPTDVDEIMGWFDSLSLTYDEDKSNIEIESKAIPEPSLTHVKDGMTEWYDLSKGQWLAPWQFNGIRYSVRFKALERELAVVVDQEGNIIRREYIDSGNYHHNEVIRFLRGWPKTIGQSQHGGRPVGITEKTYEKYRNLAERYYKSEITSQREFCKRFGCSRSTLQRALKFVSGNG